MIDLSTDPFVYTDIQWKGFSTNWYWYLFLLIILPIIAIGLVICWRKIRNKPAHNYNVRMQRHPSNTEIEGIKLNAMREVGSSELDQRREEEMDIDELLEAELS